MSFLYSQSYQNSLSFDRKDNRSIAFIDSSLINCDVLAQRVVASARAIIIGSEDDGVREISKILYYSNCSEIHIFSTGNPGCIHLGKSELSLSTLSKYSLELSSWFDKYNADSEEAELAYISLYGCNLAAGDVGEELITKLSQITQAKISASVNIFESSILY